MTARLITPPAGLAVSLDDARTAARLSGSALDGEITQCVRGITDEVEQQTGRAVVTQTYRVTLDSFPEAIRLPAPPVASVLSVKYIDTDGVEQTLDPADYELDAESEPCYLVPAPDRRWPETMDRINAVRVEVECGYGPDDTTTPSGIKSYILARVAEKYAPPGTPESPHLVRLLDRYKVY
ncbi:hypothetical protein GJ700_12695 [Duganella sp. FT92W]|uniref:Phage gp6-like head-tail connector protein n=1 Tax=Pseudoduganella rivuli TaxID=2666085 RepID=A0A7X2IMH4_9BURK|nr:hypothetical protein [Pseudoduganella rivuli]MRV72566.1 hypothetical protein [Pseudoduganella rivuli]